MPQSAIIAILRIVLTAASVFGFPYLLRRIWITDKSGHVQRFMPAILVAYSASILAITLGTRTYDEKAGVIFNLTWAYREIFTTMAKGYQVGGLLEAIKRIHWVRGTVSSLILNVFLFVPMGYLLPLSCKQIKSWWKVLLAGVVFSFCIETIQLLTHFGWFDIADPIYNGLGTMIGYSLYRKIFLRKGITKE